MCVIRKEKEDTKKRVSNAERCPELIGEQPGAEIADDSWRRASNSVTRFTGHVQDKNTEIRLDSQWYGGKGKTGFSEPSVLTKR